MKKWMIASFAAGLVAVLIFGVQATHAQGIPTTNPTPQATATEAATATTTYAMGWMHDEMIAAWADQLGLTVDEIEAQLAAGQTMYQIALAQGVSAADFPTVMAEVRSQALAQAVANGDLTQDQADWMNSRGAGMMGGGYGGGRMMGGGGYGAGRMGGRGANGTGWGGCMGGYPAQ